MPFIEATQALYHQIQLKFFIISKAHDNAIFLQSWLIKIIIITQQSKELTTVKPLPEIRSRRNP